jgi:hypothetical protein
LNSPSITDWIQAIGVMAALPLSIIAIIKLFIKDKERSVQIESLKKMAESQLVSTSNLLIQLEEIKKQTLLLSESNELIRAKNDFDKDILLKNESTNKEHLELAKLTRRNEIKPNFIEYGSIRSGYDYKMALKNVGKPAKNIKFNFSNLSNICFASINANMDLISTDRSFDLRANIVDIHNPFEYHLIISYDDEDGNCYNQSIIHSLRGSKITLPALISSSS